MNGSGSHSLGIDIGGTKVEIAVVNRDGEIQNRVRERTRHDRGFTAVIDQIEEATQDRLEVQVDELSSIGVGVAGLVDRNQGFLHLAPNLSWEDVPLGGALEDRFGRSVEIMNDVDAATWGEWKFGAGRGYEHVVTVFLGTGIGTGVITGGRMLEGHGSSAAELGHVPVMGGGRSCTAPHDGCIEAYVGGWAIGERAREAVRENRDRGSFLIEAAGSVEEITARHVSEGVKAEDPLCLELLEETGRLLGIWGVGVMNVFSPARIIMGGSVLEGLPRLQTMMEERIRENGFEPHVRGLEIVRAELDEHAPVIGAAAFARDQR